MNNIEIMKDAESIIDNILNDLIKFRHKLHEIPEIGFKEYKTSNAIREALKKYNIPTLLPYLETDVVGLINPEKKDKNITLRADIDAICQYELNTFPYKSKTEGVMHACGHDGHSTILLGTAIVLSKLKEHFPGSIRFLFQPGEEGLRGADYLMEKGLFKENKPDAILGFHNFPTLSEGVFYGKSGVFTSSVIPFKIKIIGKSIHSSTPEKGIDPIIAGTEIITEFKRIVNDPENLLYDTNLQVCKFHSGTAGNVIPPDAQLEGTARSYRQEQEENTPSIIKNIVEEICKKYNAKFEIKISPPMRLIKNNADLLNLAKKNVIEMFGSDSWSDMSRPFKFSEDFSAYHKEYPGLYLCVGAGKEKPALHTQTFDFNDNIIKKTILFWIKMTLDILYGW